MFQFIDGPDDVLAMTIANRLTSAELDAIMDRLESVMARHDKVHVFVETRSIEGIELAGLPSYMARATPLLGKLARFGRVAVVADQAWIRAWTRVESVILPFITYRVFGPEERDAALAWVKDETEPSR